MENLNNYDIRQMVAESGLNYKDIASQIGYGANYLSRLLRKPLNDNQKDKILHAIEELKNISKENESMESIISNEKVCWICGKNQNIHCHHIFGGVGRRNHSERRGFKVYLCHQHHGEAHKNINSGFSLYLKRECQKYYEEHYGSREDFINEFGKSCL